MERRQFLKNLSGIAVAPFALMEPKPAPIQAPVPNQKKTDASDDIVGMLDMCGMGIVSNQSMCAAIGIDWEKETKALARSR